jgi:hypothetical protein
MPLAPLPVFQSGEKLIYTRDGSDKIVQTVTLAGDGTQSWVESSGWQWKKKAYLERARAWKDPGGQTGEQDYGDNLDALFPLQVGKTATSTFHGHSSDGKSWTGTEFCEVADTENVTVPAGSFDTYKIVCRFGENPSNPYTTITHWYSPKVGADIVYREYTPKEGTDDTVKLVSAGTSGV